MTQKLFTKNFMLLILGQLTSLFGNFILKLALSMYVLEVTGSAAIFAGILSVATIPTIVLSPLGGILADRADKHCKNVALNCNFKIFCNWYYHSWIAFYCANCSWIKCTILWGGRKYISN